MTVFNAHLIALFIYLIRDASFGDFIDTQTVVHYLKRGGSLISCSELNFCLAMFVYAQKCDGNVS